MCMGTREPSGLSLLLLQLIFGNVILDPLCPRLFLIFRCELCALLMEDGKTLICNMWSSCLLSLILTAAENLCKICIKHNKSSFIVLSYFLLIGTWACWLQKKSLWQSNYKLTRKCLEFQSVPTSFSVHLSQSCYQHKLTPITLGERPKLWKQLMVCGFSSADIFIISGCSW